MAIKKSKLAWKASSKNASSLGSFNCFHQVQRQSSLGVQASALFCSEKVSGRQTSGVLYFGPTMHPEKNRKRGITIRFIAVSQSEVEVVELLLCKHLKFARDKWATHFFQNGRGLEKRVYQCALWSVR